MDKTTETPLKHKRNYTRRSKEEKRTRLIDRLASLKLAHATRARLIERLEAKLKA